MRATFSLTKPALAVAAVALGAAVAGGSVSAADRPATTGLPGTYAVVHVTVHDKRVTLSKKLSHGVNVVAFVVHNAGKKPHVFTIGDVKTEVLKHGKTQDVPVNFEDFGRYKYKITLNGTKSMHGVFSVLR
jgi:hypothetical protein